MCMLLSVNDLERLRGHYLLVNDVFSGPNRSETFVHPESAALRPDGGVWTNGTASIPDDREVIQERKNAG